MRSGTYNQRWYSALITATKTNLTPCIGQVDQVATYPLDFIVSDASIATIFLIHSCIISKSFKHQIKGPQKINHQLSLQESNTRWIITVICFNRFLCTNSLVSFVLHLSRSSRTRPFQPLPVASRTLSYGYSLSPGHQTARFRSPTAFISLFIASQPLSLSLIECQPSQLACYALKTLQLDGTHQRFQQKRKGRLASPLTRKPLVYGNLDRLALSTL
jgi:hypothetical protein